MDGAKEVGTGSVREEDVPLSRLITVLNDRFGTDFNEAEQLFFDQIAEEAFLDDELKEVAVANPMEKFQLVFQRVLENLFVSRMDQNENIFARYMNEPFRKAVTQQLGLEV